MKFGVYDADDDPWRGRPIGNELAKILVAKHAPDRLVGRSPKPFAGAEIIAADLSDREHTIAAVSGSNVVCLLVGLPYVFDSTKFDTEFGITGTPYSEGVRIVAESYQPSR
jgi:hypothetical protein